MRAEAEGMIIAAMIVIMCGVLWTALSELAKCEMVRYLVWVCP